MSEPTQVGEPSTVFETPNRLPFPPIHKQHILNCSVHNWHPKYRAVTPKARLIPLPGPFIEYLRGDGIILPPDGTDDRAEWSDGDSGIFSGTDNEGAGDDDEADFDPSAHWQGTHTEIGRVIEELGGKVAPKLNWSAPKDATFMNATNNMECRTPNDIYLLLKSSDFVTHDLVHAFDDTEDTPEGEFPEIPYHLVLRKWIVFNPAIEFRCFVRNRKLIGLCQRDLNHFEFLFKMQDKLLDTISDFFDKRLKSTFPDPNFTFDVYVPPPHDKAWLIDINPWAPRTDPLLFSWMELLTMPEPVDPPSDTVRIHTKGETAQSASDSSDESDDEDVEELFVPEFRLVRRDDPEAYGFSTPQYSAHKLPKEVVDASTSGNMKETLFQWKEAQRLAEEQQAEDSSDDD